MLQNAINYLRATLKYLLGFWPLICIERVQDVIASQNGRMWRAIEIQEYVINHVQSAASNRCLRIVRMSS